MKQIKVLTMLSLIFASGLTAAQEEQASAPSLTANVSVASQYVSRGFRQTWGDPALQGGVDFSHPSGFMTGTWASTVSDKLIRNASVEWDFYAGYLTQANGLTFGAVAWYYYFPGARNTAALGNTSYSYGEIVPQIAYGPVSVKYGVTVTPNYFGYNAATLGGPAGMKSRGSGYLDVTYTQPFGEGWAFTAHYGHERVRNFSQASFRDGKIALTKTVGPWVAGLALTKVWDKSDYYSALNNGEIGAPSSDPRKATVVVSLTRNFNL